MEPFHPHLVRLYQEPQGRKADEGGFDVAGAFDPSAGNRNRKALLALEEGVCARRVHGQAKLLARALVLIGETPGEVVAGVTGRVDPDNEVEVRDLDPKVHARGSQEGASALVGVQFGEDVVDQLPKNLRVDLPTLHGASLRRKARAH
jgi:hypothetical protein